MAEKADAGGVKRQVAVEAIDELFRMKDNLMQGGPDDDATRRKALAEADRLFAALSPRAFAATAAGECEMGEKYSPIRPVIRGGKLYYRCGHTPPHYVEFGK